MVKSRVIFLILFIISLLIPRSAYPAFEDDSYYYKIKDLRSDWKVYSGDENALVPYIASINSRLDNVYIPIDPEEYRNNGLLLNFNSKSAVFINNQLIYNTPGQEERIFPIDSLAAIYGPNSFLIAIYTPGGIRNLETSIVSYSKKDPALMDRMDHLSIIARLSVPVWDFMRLGVIIILVLYVVLINIGGRVFRDYYNILNSFIRAGADEFLNRTKNIPRIDLVYIVVLSLVISFFIVIIFDQITITDSANNINSFGRLLIKWLYLSVIILIWIMLRFFIISLSSDLFRMRSIGTIHAFEYLRITNFYSLVVFLLMVLAVFVFHINLVIFSYIILYSMVVFSILRALILYLKFLNSSDYTKLYLFAYLCSAELLPVIIGLRILLKSDLLHVIV